MQNDYRELTEYLRLARIGLGLTQAELARKIGYSSAQFVSNWERGAARPPISKAKKIISILKLDPNRYVDFLLMGSRRLLGKALRSKKLNQ